MIQREEFIEYAVKHNLLKYNKEKDILVDNTGFEFDVDRVLTAYRKRTGQSFECIYDEHVSCFNVIKCTECGTIILERYDENYERNLKCPVCTEYKTNHTYYTTKDIEESEDKRKEIDTYIMLAEYDEQAAKRMEKRGGFYAWQLTHTKTIFETKNTLACCSLIFSWPAWVKKSATS